MLTYNVVILRYWFKPTSPLPSIKTELVPLPLLQHKPLTDSPSSPPPPPLYSLPTPLPFTLSSSFFPPRPLPPFLSSPL